MEEKLIALIKDLGINQSTDDYDLNTVFRHRNQHEKIRAYSGASKLCLVIKDSPVVIKWSYGSEYDEAKDEAQIYQDACKEGIEAFFPKTEFLCTFNSINFFIQEKVDYSVYNCPQKKMMRYKRIGKTVKDSTVQKIQKAIDKASQTNRRNISREWAKVAVSIYGKRVCKNLCKFIVEHHINDLHRSNIGFKDDKPIILDFSGYYRNS